MAFWLAVLGAAVRFGPHTWVWFVAVVLAAIAFPLWIAARLQLGSAFTVRPEARRLVTSGLYSKIRHPVYTFGLVAALSSLLALQRWLLLAIAGILLVSTTAFRMRREEQVLQAAFGEEYRCYRKQTWF